MVGMMDEPIALSKAIQGMIKSVNSNSRLLKENNNDLIAGLSALKVTIQQAFLGLKNTTQGQTTQRANVLRDEGINTPSALLRNINSSILQQSAMLKTYLQDVPFLTSATARHETEKWRQDVLDALKRLNGGGGGPPPIFPPGFPKVKPPLPDEKPTPGDEKPKPGDEKLKPKPGESGSWLEKWLQKLKGDFPDKLPGGIKPGSLLDNPANIIKALSPTNIIKGLLAPEAIAGTILGAVGGRAGQSAAKLKAQGKSILSTQRAGNTALAIGGDAAAGAALGSIIPGAGTIAGGLLGGIWGAGVSEGDIKFNQTPAEIEASEKASGTYLGPGSQNNRIKQILAARNNNKSNKPETIGDVGNSIKNTYNGLEAWQDKWLGKIHDFAKSNLPQIDSNSPADVKAAAIVAANSTAGMVTPQDRNIHQGLTEAIQVKTQETNENLTKVLQGLLSYFEKTNLKGGGSTMPGGYSLDSYQTSGYHNMMPGIIDTAYTGGVGNTSGSSQITVLPDPYSNDSNNSSGSGSGSYNANTPSYTIPLGNNLINSSGSGSGGYDANTPSYSVPSGNNSTYSNSNLPRPVRNNNPFDLDYVKGQVGLQPGKPNDGRFGIYTSMQAGVAAAAHQLMLHPNVNTVNSIEDRYGPPTENDTSGNIKRLSAYLGSHGMSSDPNAKINYNDPKSMSTLIAGLAQIEMGAKDQMQYVPYSTIQQGVAMAEGRIKQDTPETPSTAVATNSNTNTQNLETGERPSPPTPTKQNPTNPANSGMVTAMNTSSPPMSNQIPMHITSQGLIIVNQQTVGIG